MGNRTFFVILLVATLMLPGVAAAQTGPVDPHQWPRMDVSLMTALRNEVSFQSNVQPKRDSLANGMLIGAAIGAVVGMWVMPRAMCGPNDNECSTIVRVAIGLPSIAGGVGIGALVDGLHKQQARPSGLLFNVRW